MSRGYEKKVGTRLLRAVGHGYVVVSAPPGAVVYSVPTCTTVVYASTTEYLHLKPRREGDEILSFAGAFSNIAVGQTGPSVGAHYTQSCHPRLGSWASSPKPVAGRRSLPPAW